MKAMDEESSEDVHDGIECRVIIHLKHGQFPRYSSSEDAGNSPNNELLMLERKEKSKESAINSGTLQVRWTTDRMSAPSQHCVVPLRSQQ